MHTAEPTPDNEGPGKPVDEARLDEILVRAHWLRNCFWTPGDPVRQGETPAVVPVHDVDMTYGDDPKLLLGYELHVGCGDVCGILAVVPRDEGADPSGRTVDAIARAGTDLIDLATEVRALRAALAEKRPPLVQREPVVDPFLGLNLPDGWVPDPEAIAKNIQRHAARAKPYQRK